MAQSAGCFPIETDATVVGLLVLVCWGPLELTVQIRVFLGVCRSRFSGAQVTSNFEV